MFGDLIAASDSQINAAFTNKSGNIGSGKKDKSKGEILDQRDVETSFTPELDISAGE